jgi:hypothetical protein
MSSPRHRMSRWIPPFCLLLFLLSCTGEPPEITQVFWRVSIVEDRDQDLSYQTLSLFVKPTDPDGFEDIEDLYLINDEQELFWKLDGESWAQSGSDQQVWIGSNSLKMPDGASFPAGQYRILLRDVGGDSAEQTIRLQSISLKEARTYLPRVTVSGGNIEVSGTVPDLQVWIYDSGGRYVSSVSASEGAVAIQSITNSTPALRGGFRFLVYGFVDSKNLGVTSGPYYVKP